MKKTMLIICMFTAFYIQSKGQDTIKMRKLRTEFSLSKLWSKCELRNISGVQYATSIYGSSTGAMFRFRYMLIENHEIVFGVGYTPTSMDYKYIESNLPYYILHPPEPENVKVASFPISYSYSKPFSKKYLLNAEVGYNSSIPIIVGDISHRSSSYDENKQELIREFEQKISRTNPTNNIFLSFGIKRNLKRNMLIFNFISTFALHKRKLGTYTFFPENPEFTSTGEILSSFSYFGLNLGFIIIPRK